MFRFSVNVVGETEYNNAPAAANQGNVNVIQEVGENTFESKLFCLI